MCKHIAQAAYGRSAVSGWHTVRPQLRRAQAQNSSRAHLILGRHSRRHGSLQGARVEGAREALEMGAQISAACPACGRCQAVGPAYCMDQSVRGMQGAQLGKYDALSTEACRALVSKALVKRWKLAPRSALPALLAADARLTILHSACQLLRCVSWGSQGQTLDSLKAWKCRAFVSKALVERWKLAPRSALPALLAAEARLSDLHSAHQLVRCISHGSNASHRARMGI